MRPLRIMWPARSGAIFTVWARSREQPVAGEMGGGEKRERCAVPRVPVDQIAQIDQPAGGQAPACRPATNATGGGGAARVDLPPPHTPSPSRLNAPADISDRPNQTTDNREAPARRPATNATGGGGAPGDNVCPKFEQRTRAVAD